MLVTPQSVGKPHAAGVLALLVAVVVLHGHSAEAGSVRLKNGTLIEGTAVPVQSLSSAVTPQVGELPTFQMWLVDTGLQRYFVPDRQIQEHNREADLNRLEKFKLKQDRHGGGKVLQVVGRFLEETPFDEYGRRRVTLYINGKPEHVIQGVTEIGPKHCKVTGLNYGWSHAIATTSIDPPVLDKMLRQATDQKNPNDRIAIATYYVQSAMYPQAQRELDAIERDFPDYKERIKEITLELRTLLANRLLSELRDRRNAGQHLLAYSAAKQFPTQNMSAAVLRQVGEIVAQYDEGQRKGEKALLRLGELQAQVDNPELLQAVMPLRSEVKDLLNFESLDRLEAFLRLENDPSLTPAEKLSLAYSGWVLGSANAVTDLDATLRFWKARFTIIEYLRTGDPMQRKLKIVELQSMESIGPKVVAQLIRYLPPLIETPEAVPGKFTTIDATPQVVDSAASPSSQPVPVLYDVLLPREYNPHHLYPLVVTLHTAERDREAQLVWWGGTEENPKQAQRHGYIVIAPEYAADGQKTYDYSPAAHYKVLSAIRDARKRFSVDSDRIFLSGHGMGGDAAFDIGMSHPDLFAGVIPITGVSDLYCKYYWQNAKRLGWYVVAGELDRDTIERNALDLNRMLRNGFDIIYSEYIGRGYESYYEEIHKLFDWMALHRREPLPKEFDFDVLRSTDNRPYWVEMHGLPANVTEAVLTRGANRVRPMAFKVKVSDGSDDHTVIHLTSGAERNVLWLSPDMVDFDKRLQVRHNGRQKYNAFIPAGAEAIGPMLEDFRIRADRQRLFWAKLEI